MPYGPYYNQLPVDSNGNRFVDQTSWNSLVDSWVNWKGNQNAAGYGLSNLATLSITGTAYLPADLQILGSGFVFFKAESDHIAYYKKVGVYEYYWRRSDTGHVGANDVTMMRLNDTGRLWLGSLENTTSGELILAQSGVGGNRAFRIGLDSNYALQIGDYGFTGGIGFVPSITIPWLTGRVGIKNADPKADLSLSSSTGEKIAAYDDGFDMYGIGIGSAIMRLFAGSTGVIRVGKRASANVYTDEFLFDCVNRGMVFPIGGGGSQPIGDAFMQNGSCMFHWDTANTRLLIRVRDPGGTVRQTAIAF